MFIKTVLTLNETCKNSRNNDKMKIYNLIVILQKYYNVSSLKLGKRIHFTKVQLADSFCYVWGYDNAGNPFIIPTVSDKLFILCPHPSSTTEQKQLREQIMTLFPSKHI